MVNPHEDRALSIGERVRDSVVAQSLSLLGDRWTLLTIRDMFQGRHRFEELLSHTGAVRSTLATRLKMLVDQGIVYRNPYQNSPVRYEYRLTPKGIGLYDFALSLWSWEHRWLTEDVLDVPPKLFHRGCGKQFLPVCRCNRCGKAVTAQTIVSIANPTYTRNNPSSHAAKRRSKVAVGSNKAKDASLFHAADILGDRWNNLILGCALYGLKRYDDFLRALEISSNILADRLKLLVDAGLLNRVRYQTNPDRFEYELTEKGGDYMPVAMSLHKWADKWLTQGKGGNVIMCHSCSGEALNFNFCCSACKAPLAAHEVSTKPT